MNVLASPYYLESGGTVIDRDLVRRARKRVRRGPPAPSVPSSLMGPALELTDVLAYEKIRPSAMPPPHLVYESPDDTMAAIHKNKTPGERLRVAFGLWTSARILLERILRAQHPDWDARSIRAEVARRMFHGVA